MSLFEQQLSAAKKKQRLLYIAVFVLFFIGALIVLTVILISRGTRIEIKPDAAAELSSVHLTTGIATIIGETLYSISKNPVIAVSADGFKPTTQVLNNNDFGKVMTVTLLPLPAKIELSTNIADDKISWLINGETIAIAKVFEYELDAGDYELGVTHPHYNDVTMGLSLERGEIFKKEIEIVPINGMMNINTKPIGASVSVDSVDVGLTPLTLPMQGGFHDVAVALANYETINETVEISRSRSEINRDYRLELKKAVVGLSLLPEGGELALDGIAVKQTDKLRVEASIKHRLTYSKRGYFTKTKTFNIAADETLQLAFALKKEMGSVEIESSPLAEVKLGGKLMGTTPLTLLLNAVEQKITLSKSGFRSVSKIIIPSAVSSKKISVTLIPEGIARLKEAPGQYTHKAGGTLKLFMPNDTYIWEPGAVNLVNG